MPYVDWLPGNRDIALGAIASVYIRGAELLNTAMTTPHSTSPRFTPALNASNGQLRVNAISRILIHAFMHVGLHLIGLDCPELFS